MGVKLRIIESTWSEAIKRVYKIDIVGRVFSGKPYKPSYLHAEGTYYTVQFESGTYCVKIGVRAVYHKEEIFSDKEYEELWI